MDVFENMAVEAVRDGAIPGAIACAQDIEGDLNYCSAFTAEEDQYTEDTVLEIASLTKLLTAIAAMQLLEAGSLDLQQDVAPMLPSFANKQVLGLSSVLTKRKGQLTLERLLTHTAGAAYPVVDSRLKDNKGGQAEHPAGSIEAAFNVPLSYEPGTSWMYSPAMDRVGQIVEQISGSTLDQYFREHILQPLGIDTGSFFSLSHPPMSVRTEPGAPAVPDANAHSFTRDATECFGGQGYMMTLKGFLRILESLLRNDGRLLCPDTVEELFRPRLTPELRQSLVGQLNTPGWVVGDLPDTGEYDWSFGGLVVSGDSHPFRRRGTVCWSGGPNLIWREQFIDRKAGLCGVFGTQVLPPGDSEVLPLMKAFEEGVYHYATQ